MVEPDPGYMRRMGCRCGPPPEECIPDETELTHHAKSAGAYILSPRPHEREVSLLRGRMTTEEATRYRFKLVTDRIIEQAVTRYTTAGRLRAEGFAVVHTPGKVADGPHVSVVWPTDEPMVRQDVPWPNAVSDRFKKCFDGDNTEGGSDES